MADRIGVINHGELVVVDDKAALMAKLGKKELRLHLQQPLDRVPEALNGHPLELSDDGHELIYTYDVHSEQTGIADLMRRLNAQGIDFKDLRSRESSLEEIFVSLVRARP